VSLRDRLSRRVVPRTLVALSTIRWPGKVTAAIRRALGGRGRIELFVAFDDPESAVALLGLAQRVAHRRVRLAVEPVVARGIPDDPATEDKRRYAIVDARRLARRAGLELSRGEPVTAQATAFLASWAAAAPDAPRRVAFCVAAMRELWLSSDGPIHRKRFAGLWQEHVGGEPPADDGPGARSAERRMRRRRLYDTPVAVVHGEWFFAHERLAQIEHRLDDLGWKAAA
jgi:2-hydroxychromene-2-carboxylate isomerase